MMRNSDAGGGSTAITIRKSVSHVDEDGTMGAKVIDVIFNTDTLLFSTRLPIYVADYDGSTIDSEICGDTAQGLLETYEVRCDEYHRWRKSMDKPTQLWVGVYNTVSDFAKQTFGFTQCVGIGATPVKALPNGRMIEVLADGSLGNPVGSSVLPLQPVLIEDTPEHREKVKALADSIQQAADLLAGLQVAANPAEYLMALRDDWRDPWEPAIYDAEAGEQTALDLAPLQAAFEQGLPELKAHLKGMITPDEDDDL